MKDRRSHRGKRGAFVLLAKAPERRLFLLGRCPEVAFKSPVTPTIRGKESSHMRGMRSFGLVPTCSGWGFSHIGRFLSAQDDDTGERKGFLWEIRCVFWN